MVTILTTVFHQAHPDATRLQRLPHFFKHARWHIRVPHQIVVLTNQLFSRIATDFDKFLIAVSNNPALVRGGNQSVLFWKFILPLRDGLIITHTVLAPFQSKAPGCSIPQNGLHRKSVHRKDRQFADLSYVYTKVDQSLRFPQLLWGYLRINWQ